MFVLTPGQASQALLLQRVLNGDALRRNIPGRPKQRPHRVAGDKAYSTRAIRAYLRRHAIRVTIPRKANEHRRGSFDRELYKERNQIERLINRLKQNRRLATRYEKRNEFRNVSVGYLSLPAGETGNIIHRDMAAGDGQLLTNSRSAMSVGPRLLGGAVDPSAGAGVAAPQGSLYLRTNGGAATTLYVKTGAGTRPGPRNSYFAKTSNWYPPKTGTARSGLSRKAVSLGNLASLVLAVCAKPT
jgi:transposase